MHSVTPWPAAMSPALPSQARWRAQRAVEIVTLLGQQHAGMDDQMGRADAGTDLDEGLGHVEKTRQIRLGRHEIDRRAARGR